MLQLAALGGFYDLLLPRQKPRDMGFGFFAERVQSITKEYIGFYTFDRPRVAATAIPLYLGRTRTIDSPMAFN